VHYFDPHYEYWRHPEVGFAAGSAGRLHGDEKMNRLRSLDPPPDAAELEFIRDLYDEEVRYTDLGIGRLLESLAALALDGDTIVVFVADHGEEFFERGWLGHTRTLYDELIRVPLLIRLPRERKGRSVSEPVSLASLMPTLLDLIGIETRELPFQAPSLAPLLRGRALPAPAPVYIEVDRHSEGVEQAQNAGRADLRLQPGAKPIPRQMLSKHAVIVGRYKLVEDRLSGSRELYDLERDPREQTDLAASEPRRVDELARDLEAMSTRVRATALARERSERIPTQREFDLLRQLGYLEP
jgi:arylsulfatase A-like enzyme